MNIIKYSISGGQWQSIWYNKIDPTLWCASTADRQYNKRLKLWDNLIKPTFHLSYCETLELYSESYWGSIEGDEKYINLFLLTL